MTQRFWTVRVGIPTQWKGGGSYDAQHNIGVAAPTAEEAIARVRQEYPDCKVWALTHHGEIQISFDMSRPCEPPSSSSP